MHRSYIDTSYLPQGRGKRSRGTIKCLTFISPIRNISQPLPVFIRSLFFNFIILSPLSAGQTKNVK